MQTDSKTWTFSEFIEAITSRLQTVKAKVVQRGEDSEGTSWWFTFNRASSTYRVSFDRKTGTLLMEKGQGSFVANSQPTWRILDRQDHSDPTFESCARAIETMLGRFK